MQASRGRLCGEALCRDRLLGGDDVTFADEAEFAAFIGRDSWLPKVTPDSVGKSLDGFTLSLLPDKTMDWLAMAVRRSLAISMRSVSAGPDRTSNADIRAELERLAELAGSTWLELFQCSDATDSRLWTIAWRRWDGEGGNVGEPLEYRRYKAAVKELDWLAGFLRLAAKETESPRGPWREKERKWLRIERAQYLAPVFESAFGERVTANNFPTDPRHKAPTPFMDFYARMITLAFGAREAVNFTEVVKAARQRHRQHPVQFAEGIIPGL